MLSALRPVRFARRAAKRADAESGTFNGGVPGPIDGKKRAIQVQESLTNKRIRSRADSRRRLRCKMTMGAGTTRSIGSTLGVLRRSLAVNVAVGATEQRPSQVLIMANALLVGARGGGRKSGVAKRAFGGTDSTFAVRVVIRKGHCAFDAHTRHGLFANIRATIRAWSGGCTATPSTFFACSVGGVCI